jgi:hypothetical protein
VASVPLAVTVEIRALDTGTRLVRAFRVTRELDDNVIRFERDLPFEPGRPVTAELTLPSDNDDDDQPIVVTGVAAPAAVVLRSLDADARRRLDAYIAERTRTP